MFFPYLLLLVDDFMIFHINDFYISIYCSSTMYQLVNTLTANYEYSRSYTENFPLPMEMQLPEKPKTFFQFFIAF